MEGFPEANKKEIECKDSSLRLPYKVLISKLYEEFKFKHKTLTIGMLTK